MPTRIQKPIRPGTVIRFQGEPTPAIPPSVAETVAMPIVHDWGPINTPVLLNSFPQFETEFGGSVTPGRTAVLGAFAGMGLPGQGGAGAVWAYRMAKSSTTAVASVGATSSKLDLTAKYPGARGNLLKVAIEADASGDVLKQQARVLLNNAQVERFSYTKANPQLLVDAISQRSNYIFAALGGIRGTAPNGTIATARLVSGRTVAIDTAGAAEPLTVDWADPSPDQTETAVGAGFEHTYSADGTYVIKVRDSAGNVANDITLSVVLPWPAATALTNAVLTLAGGDDGASGLTITDWLAATTAMQYLPFSVFVPYDLTDGPIRGGLVNWVKGQEQANRPVMAVFGGASTESVDTAIADVLTMNCEHVVRLSGGYFKDSILGTSVSTSQLAPRVAGMLAALGDANSITYKPIGGLSYIGKGFDNDQIEAAIQNGVTAIAVSTNPAAALRIERGLTTWITKTDPTKPYDFFSDPRLVRLVDLFIRRMKEWGDNTMIGNVPVNDDSRTALRARARAEIDTLEDRGLIVPGTDYLDVPVPTDPDLLDSLIFEFGFQCARTALYIFGFGSVR